MKKQITAENAPPTKGFPLSHAVEIGDLVFVSGQIHLDENMNLLDGTIEEKTHQTIKNIHAILEAADTNLDAVVKATIYVTDMKSYPEVNKVYATYFSEPYPAREVVCVKSLPLNAEIEISVIAHK